MLLLRALVRAPLEIEDLILSASAVEPLLEMRTVYFTTTPSAARVRSGVFRRDPDCKYWSECLLSSVEILRAEGVLDTPFITTALLGTLLILVVRPMSR